MNITQEHKEEIQWFIYFLFKGTLNSELISNHRNYVQNLIDDPRKLIKCFEIFALNKMQGNDYQYSKQRVAQYIIKNNCEQEIELSSFWKEFIKVSEVFCNATFELNVRSFKLEELDGCGTDAVPYFAVWTNTIEIDELGLCINANEALKRANERLLLWDDDSLITPPFTEKELEQEIY
ncbi:MAG: hypothetical protein HRT58_09815 [Crocinitomicaceae bacterium]|nr:hypothetical protein [Flavobacteriales bacterium]NQZ35951.1 hypothetical protein [Crocinitomicaceae bacterium]